MLQSDDEESKIELDPTDSKRASGRQAEPACVVPTLGPIFSQRDDVMNISWIKLFRKFKEWGWYKDSHMVHLFIHFLLSANYRDNEWMGIYIRRGQVATGLRTLSEDTGISIQTIRTCINRLKSTREITIKSTNRFSVITIENYEEYQNKEPELTHKPTGNPTNDQQTTNKQLTTIKERKERKERKEEILMSPAKHDDCPQSEIVDAYHSILPMLPGVRKWTDARRRKLKARWGEDKECQSLDWWKDYFSYIKTCPFLIGDNDRGWQPDLEWLIEKSNFVKVIEGYYEPTRKKYR